MTETNQCDGFPGDEKNEREERLLRAVTYDILLRVMAVTLAVGAVALVFCCINCVLFASGKTRLGQHVHSPQLNRTPTERASGLQPGRTSCQWKLIISHGGN